MAAASSSSGRAADGRLFVCLLLLLLLRRRRHERERQKERVPPTGRQTICFILPRSSSTLSFDALMQMMDGVEQRRRVVRARPLACGATPAAFAIGFETGLSGDDSRCSPPTQAAPNTRGDSHTTHQPPANPPHEHILYNNTHSIFGLTRSSAAAAPAFGHRTASGRCLLPRRLLVQNPESLFGNKPWLLAAAAP